MFAHRQAGVGWLECPKVGEPTKIDPKASPHTAEINAIGFGRDKPFLLQNKRYEEDRLIVLPVFIHTQIAGDFLAQSPSKTDPRICIDGQQPIRD